MDVSLYTYWVIRYVPDVLRGEFVNLGVLVGRDGGDWALRRVRSHRRANRLGGDAARTSSWLTWLQHEVDDYNAPPLIASDDHVIEGFSLAQVQRLQMRLNNTIQLSEPLPVESENAREAANFLYEFLVDEAAIPARSATRRQLTSRLQHEYQLAGFAAGETLQRSPRAVTGRQRGRFDFAVTNDEVRQLSQVWSFDLADVDRLEQEIHAWSFLVTRLRNDGGQLQARESHTQTQIPADVPISVVYQLPSAARFAAQRDVFVAAEDAWSSLAVDLVPSSRIHDVPRELVAA